MAQNLAAIVSTMNDRTTWAVHDGLSPPSICDTSASNVPTQSHHPFVFNLKHSVDTTYNLIEAAAQCTIGTFGRNYSLKWSFYLLRLTSTWRGKFRAGVPLHPRRYYVVTFANRTNSFTRRNRVHKAGDQTNHVTTNNESWFSGVHDWGKTVAPSSPVR